MPDIKKTIANSLIATALVASPAVILTSVQTASAATPADNLTAAKRLNGLLKNAKSMSAAFTQTTKGGSTGQLSARNGTFSGTMSVERPNKFRWNTTAPSEQLIVTNGNTLWVYDKDLEQVTKQRTDSQMGNTPALLLSGDPSKIAKNFKITQPNGKKNYYVLYPKSDSANFKSLAISFSGGKPVMMVLNDSLGQTTRIKFSNIKLNGAIADSQFSFRPPKGVDVIAQ